MRITRRHVAIAGALAAGASILSVPAFAESADEASLGQAVEALRKAMVDADRAKLEELVSDQLSYGHSSGKVQDKADYIDVIANKKTIYKTITLTEPVNSVAGNNGIARHIFSADVDSDGKVSSVRIGVLQVWTKQGASWKLLARQAFKL